MATSANSRNSKAAVATIRKGPAVLVGAPAGAPLALPVDLIDEDPDQPRTAHNPGFSPSRLAELAATISARGVKTPISVRENPNAPGRYLVNHGARRLRASKLAGASTIPGFIDNDYNDADQVIENLQRNELTAREIADYIGRQLSRGMKRAEIAKSIGKSAAFITQHVNLLDLPLPLAEAFNGGRARDVTVISELVKAYKADPEVVSTWLQDERQEITRGAVATLRAFLADREEQGEMDSGADDALAGADNGRVQRTDNGEGASAGVQTRAKPLALHVMYKKRSAILLPTRRPSAATRAWIRLSKDDSEIEVPLAELRLVALKERV